MHLKLLKEHSILGANSYQNNAYSLQSAPGSRFLLMWDGKQNGQRILEIILMQNSAFIIAQEQDPCTEKAFCCRKLVVDLVLKGEGMGRQY